MGAFNTVLNDTVYGKAFVTRDIPIFFTPAGDVGYPYPTYPDITELYFVLTAHLYKFSGGVDCRTIKCPTPCVLLWLFDTRL